MAVIRVRGPEEVKALAARLNGNERARPVALISIPATTDVPWIDADELEHEFGPLVEVVTIKTGPDTWTLTDFLPQGTQVYGGAGRVYPVGHEWTSNLSRSPLRFAFDVQTGARTTRELVADGLGMAAATGLMSARPTQPVVAAAGIVKGIPAPGRALIELSDRQLATVAQELTLPEIPLGRILDKGMRVVGKLDTAQKRLDIREMIRPLSAVRYEAGHVALAVVTDVDADVAWFELFPGLKVQVGRTAITSYEHDDLRSFFTVGEVTTVRVLAHGPSWSLSLIDIDDDETVCPAPSIVEGGPPWLSPPPAPEPWTRPLEASVELAEPAALSLPDFVVADTPITEADPPSSSLTPHRRGPSPLLLDPRRRSDQPEAPASAAQTSDDSPSPSSAAVAATSSRSQATQLHNTIAAAKAQLKAAAEKLQALQAERDLIAARLSRSQLEITGLKSEGKRLRTELRKKSRLDPQHHGTHAVFSTPSDQFRHDVYTAWIERIPAPEKSIRPLATYEIGPQFLESLERLEGIRREKVMDVVVEVLTGLVRQVPGRELHRLRTSGSGGAPPLTRPDGAVAWRVSLQVASPSARRLHYWQRTDGGVELGKVCLHDDFTI